MLLASFHIHLGRSFHRSHKLANRSLCTLPCIPLYICTSCIHLYLSRIHVHNLFDTLQGDTSLSVELYICTSCIRLYLSRIHLYRIFDTSQEDISLLVELYTCTYCIHLYLWHIHLYKIFCTSEDDICDYQGTFLHWLSWCQFSLNMLLVSFHIRLGKSFHRSHKLASRSLCNLSDS